MSTLASEARSGSEAHRKDPESIDTGEVDTTTGGNRDANWEIVAKTAGLTTAEVIVGRLRAEGIPARAWQEGAGQAFGLTVGLLGTGYVLVPESFTESAKSLLKEAEQSEEAFSEVDLEVKPEQPD
jgi:hypothetical protein